MPNSPAQARWQSRPRRENRSGTVGDAVHPVETVVSIGHTHGVPPLGGDFVFMKTSLDHLPEPKQAELRDIVAIFCEGAPIEMLILFGSHARGDWAEDRETGY
jgi:hypothetical protein